MENEKRRNFLNASLRVSLISIHQKPQKEASDVTFTCYERELDRLEAAAKRKCSNIVRTVRLSLASSWAHRAFAVFFFAFYSERNVTLAAPRQIGGDDGTSASEALPALVLATLPTYQVLSHS